MPIEAFQVEKWMDTHETLPTLQYNLAETCCASISLNDLLSYASKNSGMAIDALSLLTPDAKQGYGEIRGSSALRTNLAGLYSARTKGLVGKEGVLIVNGAIGGNFLAVWGVLCGGVGSAEGEEKEKVGAGKVEGKVEDGEAEGEMEDGKQAKRQKVVCMYPTYQQLYSVPRSLGAEVKLWRARREETKWRWSVEELKKLCEGNTKLIVLNNPNNPTGAILTKPQLQEVADFAKSRNITILCDEVYRPIFHGIGPMDEDFPPSALSLPYDNIIVTGSLSKAYSLAGIRVGWVASRSKALIELLAEARHYTTISVSQMDQQVAALATSSMCLHEILGRNIRLAKENLGLLTRFVEEHRECEWVRPVAGTTAFVRFVREGRPVDDVVFCERVQEETGVMLLPGSRGFGDEEGDRFKGFVRFGYVNETEIVREGLEKLRGFMSTRFKDVPVVNG